MATSINKKVFQKKRKVSKYTPTPVEKFALRLPKGLHEQMKTLAKKNNRSMNSEIIWILQNYIQETTKIEFSENTLAEQKVNERLEDLKDALLHLIS